MRLRLFTQARRAGNVNVRLGNARLSKFMLLSSLVQRISDNAVFASLGNAQWAASGLPMDVRVEPVAPGLEEVAERYKFSSRGPATWLHVTDLTEWRVLPWVATRRPQGVVLEKRGEPVSLLRHSLANKADLNCDDLVRVADNSGLEMTEAEKLNF